MKAPRRKKHHIIPKFLLKGFTDSSGDLWECSLQHLCSSIKKPAQVAHEMDFYSFDTIDGKSDAVEIHLSKVENKAAEIIAALRKTRDLPSIEQWEGLLYFLALQCFRTRSYRNYLVQITKWHDSRLDHLEKMNLIDGRALALERLELEYRQSSNFLSTFILEEAKRTAIALGKRGTMILYGGVDTNLPVALGDEPFIIEDLRATTRPPDDQFDPFGPDSRLILPLASDMVYVSESLPIESYGLLNDYCVRAINTTQLNLCHKSLYSSEKDIATFDSNGDDSSFDRYCDYARRSENKK